VAQGHAEDRTMTKKMILAAFRDHRRATEWFTSPEALENIAGRLADISSHIFQVAGISEGETFTRTARESLYNRACDAANWCWLTADWKRAQAG